MGDKSAFVELMRVRLEDVCEKESSKLKQSDVIDQNGLYPVYGASGYLGNINTYQQSNYYIAVVKDGAGIGRTMLLPPESSIIGTMQYLIPKDNVLPEYLYYVVKAKHLEKYFSGATIPHIYFKDYKNEQFDLVSFEEQREIINRLKKIEIIIDNLSKNLLLLDELVRARFVEMFGDPIENPYSFPILKLGELSELITKGASPSWQGYSYTEDITQTLFVTSENVREGYMDFSSIKYVEDAFNEKQKRSMIKKGDYLINIVGASIGRAAQFDMDCKANMNQAAALVRIKDNTVLDNYLLYYLNSDKAQMMYNSMKSDTGRANLSLQDIANLEILVPDLTLQVKFASFVKEIDKSRSRIQKSLEASQELFDSLMQEYFG